MRELHSVVQLVGDAPEFTGRNSTVGQIHSGVTQLSEFEPNGKPAFFAVAFENIESAMQYLERIETACQKYSIVTVRKMPKRILPNQQPFGTVYLPFDDAKTHVQVVRSLMGDFTICPSPGWFLPNRIDAENSKAAKRLDQAFAAISIMDILTLNVERLAEIYQQIHGWCKRTLERDCRVIYGTSPGFICRILRSYIIMNLLMHKKATSVCSLLEQLKYTNTDFCRSLKRLTGTRLSEMRQKSEHEFWFAVWLRKWKAHNEFSN